MVTTVHENNSTIQNTHHLPLRFDRGSFRVSPPAQTLGLSVLGGGGGGIHCMSQTFKNSSSAVA